MKTILESLETSLSEALLDDLIQIVNDSSVNIESLTGDTFAVFPNNPAKIPLIVKKIQQIPHYFVSDITNEQLTVQYVDHEITYKGL